MKCSWMSFKICYGTTRTVILINKIAVKTPRLCKWTSFLWGLLANLQERKWSSMRHPKLARIYWSDCIGFIVIMERADSVLGGNDAAPEIVDFFNMCEKDGLPVDGYAHNIGVFNGEWKLIDYGS